MQLFTTFIQQQSFGTWRDVETPERCWIVWDISFGLVSEQGEIIFTRH
jgi:hypothetical protein